MARVLTVVTMALGGCGLHYWSRADASLDTFNRESAAMREGVDDVRRPRPGPLSGLSEGRRMEPGPAPAAHSGRLVSRHRMNRRLSAWPRRR